MFYSSCIFNVSNKGKFVQLTSASLSDEIEQWQE